MQGWYNLTDIVSFLYIYSCLCLNIHVTQTGNLNFTTSYFTVRAFNLNLRKVLTSHRCNVKLAFFHT